MTTRRAFIGVLGGAAAWPVAARAQQSTKIYRIGVLMGTGEGDPEGHGRVAALRHGLEELGWSGGRNAQFDIRFSGGDAQRARTYAAELLGLAPDVVVAHSHLTVGPLQQATRTVPIVFVQVLDPVGAGVVANLARPGGNITGFSSFEYPMSSKWLELLKEVAPKTAKAVVLTHSAFASGPAQLQVVRSVAPSLGVEVEPIDVQDAAAIEPALAGIAREANVGMVVTTSTFATLHRELIVGLAARYRLPAVYPYRYYAAAGGLLSYGIDVLDLYRRAASYVDRVLRGAQPADLPVQQPTKFELVINAQTARTLGLSVAPTLLARADEVIE